MTASTHICSDSSVLPFDSVYSKVLCASKNKRQKFNSSYNKTVVYATTQVFLLSVHPDSVPQWSTVIHVLQVGGIFCVLEKAFDCVNHDILLSKLKFYGISDKDFRLYQSYLDNRFCRTAVYNDSENGNKV